ncbi:hypothetical protein UFOVP1226_48 [uncultured Caudovirales phage]|uniref:Uncharacterized protein n=1 Tax=uncultured Caudovirales phage TaxID=2100421 RepID=A0A6J5R2N5_9CAUD|nr:hypothetical protein UFOVP278_49 [uncultured Caudovirales phage]CAB4191500.1 hypothetical protein UFOVP1226_48 [uncultured Caudovirales phage]
MIELPLRCICGYQAHINRLEAQLEATERNRPETMTAPRCTICAYPQEPSLVNVTNMEDELPRWFIGWHCNNSALHDYLRKQQDNQQWQ